MINYLKYGFIHTLFIFLFLSGCSTTPRYVDMTSLPQGEVTLQQICDLYDIEWYWDSFSQVITLDNQGTEVVAMVGSHVVLMGDKEVSLSGPLERRQSMIIVPPDFHQKVIGKRYTSTDEKKFVELDDQFDHKVRRFKKIIIDPGHGAKDPGAIGKMGTQEKDVVLDVSKRLAYILEDYGIDIVMTRKTDKFITLAKRTEIASRSDADLFISVHANASSARSVHGFEVFYLRNLDQKGKNEDQRRMNERRKFKDLAMHHRSGEVKSIVSDMLYAHKQTLSPDLAYFIAHETAQDIRASNRGEKQAGFFVLRNTLIPAILIEIGFLSNPKEEKKLRSSHHRQKVAESIAKNILSYDGQF